LIPVFVFTGEFGYELLNWQGVVQRFHHLHPRVPFVAASRGQVAALYPGGTYVDIGDVKLLRESVASGYMARVPCEEPPFSRWDPDFDRRLRRELRRTIRARLRVEGGWLGAAATTHALYFVFSSSRTRLGSSVFGARPELFGSVPGEGDIYELLDLSNNFYQRIAPDLRHRGELEERAGVSLGEPYVLVQSRKRGRMARSTATVPETDIVQALARQLPVLLVDFSTGRAGDSFSVFADMPEVRRVAISGFDQQSCLIALSHACVFLTEGDFGSHTYVPPMLGRDVHAIAPADVYELGTTPLGLWNRRVFGAGGQILPIVAESLESPEALDAFAQRVASAR
jgi:hypothetical protein